MTKIPDNNPIPTQVTTLSADTCDSTDDNSNDNAGDNIEIKDFQMNTPMTAQMTN
jgi:hypothetical protein